MPAGAASDHRSLMANTWQPVLGACGDHDKQSSGAWPQRPSCQQPVPGGGHRRAFGPSAAASRAACSEIRCCRPQRSSREFQWFPAGACQLGQPVTTAAPWPTRDRQCLAHEATTTSSPAVLGRSGQVANSQCRPAGTAEHSGPLLPARWHRDLRSSGSRPQRSIREFQWFTAAACQLGRPVITNAHSQDDPASACRMRRPRPAAQGYLAAAAKLPTASADRLAPPSVRAH